MILIHAEVLKILTKGANLPPGVWFAACLEDGLLIGPCNNV